jgi:WD40 repeat protein
MKACHLLYPILALALCSGQLAGWPPPPPAGSEILDAAFLGNSGRCVTAHRGGGIVVWDLATGQPMLSSIRLPVPFLSFAVSPDSRRVACGNVAGGIVILDLATGKELRSFTAGDEAPVTILRWSPDGKSLVSSDYAVVEVWDVRTGKRVRTIRLTQPICCLAFSPDSKSLALGPWLRGYPPGKAEDVTVKLVDLDSGTVRRSFVGPRGGLICGEVAFSPDGRLLLGTSSDVLIWNVALGEIRRKVKSGRGRVCSAAFTPDSKRVLLAGEGQPIRLVDVASGKEVLRCDDPAGSPFWYSAVMSPDGKRILGFVDSSLVLWDGETGEKILTLTGPPIDPRPPISWLLSCPKAPHLLARDDAGSTLLWDYRKGKVLRQLTGKLDWTGEPGGIAWAAFTPDGEQLFTSDDNGCGGPFYRKGARLRLWDVAGGKVRKSFPRDLTFVCPVAVSPDGRVGAVGRPGALELLDLGDGRRTRLLEVKGKKRTAHPLFTPDGTHVIAWGGGGPVQIWRLKDGRLVHTFPHEYLTRSVAVSPDSRQLVIAGSRLVIYELPTGRPVRVLEGGDDNGATAVAFSPDGTLVLSATQHGTIRLWDAKTGAVVRQLIGKGRNYVYVHAVAFLGDGKLAASGDSEGLIRIWDVTTGKELRQLKKK